MIRTSYNELANKHFEPSKSRYAPDQTQLVAVKFKGSDKPYTYVGSGNLRAGQVIDSAPVNHSKTNKPYTAPVTVTKTAGVVGAKVGDHTGITEDGKVRSIPKPLKALPGNAELKRNDTASFGGESINSGEYISQFKKGGNK